MRSEFVGLDADFAQILEAVFDAFDDAGGVSLVVVSGYRSPEVQAELRRRWLAGDRRGIAAEPAARSAHTAGMAVDLQFRVDGALRPVKGTPRGAWRLLAKIMEPEGIVWGGRFTKPDWNHYEMVRELV